MGSKLQKEMISVAEQLMASGAYRKYLANHFKVTPKTISDWENRGRNSNRNDIYKQFADAIERGEIEYQQKLLTQINAAGTKGVKTTKKKVTKDSGGNILESTEEEAASVQLRAVIWQLEKRFNWSEQFVREQERVLNQILRIAEKNLTPEQYGLLVKSVVQSKLGEELQLDSELFL